jgi:phosphohistidine phosphatase
MARRLVVMRHAQAAGGALTDLGRPLTPKGRRDAASVGARLADLGLVPDAAVISPASRTRQTWAEVSTALEHPPAPMVEPRIYEASATDLLAVLNGTPPEVGTIVLIGHNPGVHALATQLDDRTGEATARAVLARAFPPASAAVFAVEAPWSGLVTSGATLISFGWYAGASGSAWTWLGADKVAP